MNAPAKDGSPRFRYYNGKHVEIPAGYRMLRVGELIKGGDLVWSGGSGPWVSNRLSGKPYKPSWVYGGYETLRCRKLETGEKALLEL